MLPAWISVLWNNPIVRGAGYVVTVLAGLKFAESMVRRDARKDERRRQQVQAMEKLESVKDTLDEKLEQTRKLDRNRPSVTDADSVPEHVAGNIFRN